MQRPVCTVRTYALRVGNRRYALEAIGACTAIGAMFCAFFYGISFVEDSQDMQLVEGLIFIAVVFLTMGCFLYVATPRAIMRVSATGIRIRSYYLIRSGMIPWHEIEQCSLARHCIRLKLNGRVHEFRSGNFKKYDWLLLRDTINHYCRHYFGFDIKSEAQRHASFGRNMTTKEFILDKVLLCSIVIFPFGMAAVFFLASRTVPVWIAATVTLLCLTAWFLSIMRYMHRWNLQYWTVVNEHCN